MISKEQLFHIFREAPKSRVLRFLPHLNETADEFEISTPQRLRMFLAQIGHESGQLRYVKELASGEAYEGRKDLGNTEPGDGVRYKGRGLIQITGRANYGRVALGLGLPLLEKPELLEEDEPACRSAGWYWYKRNLNSFADMDAFDAVSDRINMGRITRTVGDSNGYADRYKLYLRACEVM